MGVRDTVDKLDGVFHVGAEERTAKKERTNEVDPRGCPRRQRPVVISMRVDTGSILTIEVETEKVPRATSIESATTLLYFSVILAMDEVPLVEVMLQLLSK